MSYSWISYLSAKLLHWVCHQIKRHFHRAESPKVSRSPPIKQCHPKDYVSSSHHPPDRTLHVLSRQSHTSALLVTTSDISVSHVYTATTTRTFIRPYREPAAPTAEAVGIHPPCMKQVAKFSACLSPDATGASLPTTIPQHTASWVQQLCAEAGIVEGR